MLPFVLSAALIAAANAVVVSETTPEWWERPGNPGERLDERTLLREVRLLTMSDFDLFQETEESSGRPFWTLFVTAERHSEAPSRAIQLSTPRPDGLTALLMVVPAGVTIVSLLAAACLRCLAGSISRRNSGAFMTAVAAFAPWASLLCGIVLLSGFLCCLGGLRNWRGADVAAAVLALGGAAAFVLVGGHPVVAYIRGSGPRLRRAGFLRFELMPILGWWLLCGLVAAGGMMLIKLAE